MATMKFEVAAFDGRNNFGLWRIKMLALLRREGSEYAWDKSYPDDMKTSEKAEEEKKAHSAILLSLSDKVLCQVGNEKTAAELWAKLEALYMKKSVTTRLYLKRRLFTFKMKEGTPLQDHLEEFNQIVMDMENAEIKTADEDLACVLLFSLPSAYDNFVNSMMHGRDTLKLEDVRSSLNSAEMRNMISGSDRVDSGDGLAARGRLTTRKGRGRSKGRSKSRGADKSNLECYYCHKKGHFKSECKVLESKNKRNQQKETPSASHVEEGNESDTSGEFVLTACGSDGAGKQWVLDSGCTFHMCFSRDWFTTYEKRA